MPHTHARRRGTRLLLATSLLGVSAMLLTACDAPTHKAEAGIPSSTAAAAATAAPQHASSPRATAAPTLPSVAWDAPVGGSVPTETSDRETVASPIRSSSTPSAGAAVPAQLPDDDVAAVVPPAHDRETSTVIAPARPAAPDEPAEPSEPADPSRPTSPAEPDAHWPIQPSPEPSSEPEPTYPAEPDPHWPIQPTPEPSETADPGPTATADPEPSEPADPEPSPKPSETAGPEPTATAAPELTATASPEPSETTGPEPTAPASPEPSEPADPEPTAPASPEPTDPPIPGPTSGPTEPVGSEPSEPSGPSRVSVIAMPHLDDEIQTASLWPLDASAYTVFVSFTRGEQTWRCEPDVYAQTYDPLLGELPASVAPDGRWTASCETARIDSTLGFLTQLGETLPSLPSEFGARQTWVAPVDGVVLSRLDDTTVIDDASTATVDSWIDAQGRGAVVRFNLGDGDLTSEEVDWALRTLLSSRGELGLNTTLPIDGIIGPYWSDGQVEGSASYDNGDHEAVHTALRATDYGARYQALPVPAADPSATVTADVDAAVWDAAFGSDGAFGRHYGWLEPGSWPNDRGGQSVLFHGHQTFWTSATP